MDSMESENRKYLRKRLDDQKSSIEGEVVVRGAAAHRDLLDLALASLDVKILYPSPSEWQQLTHRVRQHVCASRCAIDAVIERAVETPIAAPDASEWAALSHGVRERVFTRKRKAPFLRRFVETVHGAFSPLGAEQAALVLTVVLCVFLVAAITYAEFTSVVSQMDLNLFQPIADRTAYINEAIRGNIVVAAAPFSQRFYYYEQGRG
jgi:hypothetical protein